MSRIDSILVKVNDDQHIITHCFLSFNFDGENLLVEYFIDDGTFLQLVHQERLSFYEHPELMELHDKHGWDIPALQEFVAGSVSNFDEQPPTTTLTTLDS